MDWLKRIFGRGGEKKARTPSGWAANEPSNKGNEEREKDIPFSPPSKVEPEDIEWRPRDYPINRSCNDD